MKHSWCRDQRAGTHWTLEAHALRQSRQHKFVRCHPHAVWYGAARAGRGLLIVLMVVHPAKTFFFFLFCWSVQWPLFVQAFKNECAHYVHCWSIKFKSCLELSGLHCLWRPFPFLQFSVAPLRETGWVFPSTLYRCWCHLLCVYGEIVESYVYFVHSLWHQSQLRWRKRNCCCVHVGS